MPEAGMDRMMAEPEGFRAEDEEWLLWRLEILRQSEEARKLKAERAFQRARQEQVNLYS